MEFALAAALRRGSGRAGLGICFVINFPRSLRLLKFLAIYESLTYSDKAPWLGTPEFPVALQLRRHYYAYKLGLVGKCGCFAGRSMISGFNTEIAAEGTLFHIQTEARKEKGIETALYVKGAVVHSFKTLHPELFNTPAGNANDRQFMRLLEEQHHRVIAQIRSGEIKPPPSPA